MPNYKETTLSGSKWTRAVRVNLNNPYGGIPSITFEEEQIIVAGDSTFSQPPKMGLNTNVSQQFIDPAITFDLLDPATDTVIGTATHGQVYALMYSLYKACALERDARVAAAVAPPVQA